MNVPGFRLLNELSASLFALSLFICPLIFWARGYRRPGWMMAAGAIPWLVSDLEFKYHNYVANDLIDWMQGPKPFWGLSLAWEWGSLALFTTGFVLMVKIWMSQPPARESI